MPKRSLDEVSGDDAPEPTAGDASPADGASASTVAAGSSAPVPPPEAGPIGSAQWWFYRTPEGQEQGPQPVSAMRSWYEAGYFEGVTVAASYYGEVPDAFLPIDALWLNPSEEAFVLTDGSAEAVPTEQEAPPFIPATEFAGAREGYVFKLDGDQYGLGYYQDVSHQGESGAWCWGPKPEVTAESLTKLRAEQLAKVRSVPYDENVTM